MDIPSNARKPRPYRRKPKIALDITATSTVTTYFGLISAAAIKQKFGLPDEAEIRVEIPSWVSGGMRMSLNEDVPHLEVIWKKETRDGD